MANGNLKSLLLTSTLLAPVGYNPSNDSDPLGFSGDVFPKNIMAYIYIYIGKCSIINIYPLIYHKHIYIYIYLPIYLKMNGWIIYGKISRQILRYQSHGCYVFFEI